MGGIVVVKGWEQRTNKIKLETVELVRHKLEDGKRNLLFSLQRLWFLTTKNKLMFWGGVVTLSILLGATLALFTPLWSARTTLNPQQDLTKGFLKARSPADLLKGSSQYQLARPVNILLLGIDPPNNIADTSPAVFNGTSDTMLLVRLNPETNFIRVLSIPKDSQVVIPGIGLEKISLANSVGGSAMAARVVSRTLNNVPIDRYVRMTTNAFGQLVDQLGGIEVFVPEKMSYRDVSEKLVIDLEPGWQNLNGNQAEQFVRFRDSSVGDLTRVQRQQVLLKALRDRLNSPALLPQLPQIARVVQNYVDTNLSLEEILALVNFGEQIEQDHFQMVLLPGNLSPLSRDPSSYWLDPGGQDRVMGEYFGMKPLGITSKPRPLTSLKIALQNASGKPNLSQRVAQELKNKGFEKVYTVSDWADLERETQIIVQRGNQSAAQDLQQVLGLGKIEPASTGDVDSYLTIRIGQDWISASESTSTTSNKF